MSVRDVPQRALVSGLDRAWSEDRGDLSEIRSQSTEIRVLGRYVLVTRPNERPIASISRRSAAVVAFWYIVSRETLPGIRFQESGIRFLTSDP